MSEELKKEAWGWLKPVQTVNLATWDGKLPRVRPVSLIFDGERFWACTGTNDAKVGQLKGDPGFEFSLMLVGDGCNGTLRGSGQVRFVEDPEEKRVVADKIPFFSDYWESPSEPSFCAFELCVDSVEFMMPGEMTAVTFQV